MITVVFLLFIFPLELLDVVVRAAFPFFGAPQSNIFFFPTLCQFGAFPRHSRCQFSHSSTSACI